MPEILVYAILRRYATEDCPEWRWKLIDSAIDEDTADLKILLDIQEMTSRRLYYYRDDYDIVECMPIPKTR